MSPSNKKKIVIAFTGSISCYKGCELISLLIKDGFEVQTVATQSALKFIGTATLEGLTDKPVLTGMFGPKENKVHITLSKWADLILLYPASANTINKISAGIADELIGALFLANNFQKPFWVAPAMNMHMLAHPATSDSLTKLEKWGAKILPTEEGVLACGDIGKGKLLSAQETFKLIKEYFK